MAVPCPSAFSFSSVLWHSWFMSSTIQEIIETLTGQVIPSRRNFSHRRSAMNETSTWPPFCFKPRPSQESQWFSVPRNPKRVGVCRWHSDSDSDSDSAERPGSKYPVQDTNTRIVYHTGIPENHTLSSGTSPYSKYRGVPPPPPPRPAARDCWDLTGSFFVCMCSLEVCDEKRSNYHIPENSRTTLDGLLKPDHPLPPPSMIL